MIRILPLAPERLDDWLAFFEGPAFVDNPKWSTCYCAYNYLDHDRVEWALCTGAENRERMCRWIGTGHVEGLLAYEGDCVVGWLNAAPRERYPAYALGDAEDARTAVATCFVIDPAYRRQGIAGALLDAACEHFATRGFVAIEAWPNTSADSEAAHYHGPLALYQGRGFVEVAERHRDELHCLRRDLST